jgi:beta-N-acetylhexosaminidase
MEGASVAGGVVQRAEAALQAGCDMVLVCNKPDSADALLAGLKWEMPAPGMARLIRMHGRLHPESWVRLHEDKHYVAAVHAVGSIGVRSGDLPLQVCEPGTCGTCGNK